MSSGPWFQAAAGCRSPPLLPSRGSLQDGSQCNHVSLHPLPHNQAASCTHSTTLAPCTLHPAAAAEVKNCATRLGYVWQSTGCDSFYWQRVGRRLHKGNGIKFAPGGAQTGMGGVSGAFGLVRFALDGWEARASRARGSLPMALSLCRMCAAAFLLHVCP